LPVNVPGGPTTTAEIELEKAASDPMSSTETRPDEAPIVRVRSSAHAFGPVAKTPNAAPIVTYLLILPAFSNVSATTSLERGVSSFVGL
jgi:hypothetical protein